MEKFSKNAGENTDFSSHHMTAMFIKSATKLCRYVEKRFSAHGRELDKIRRGARPIQA